MCDVTQRQVISATIVETEQSRVWGRRLSKCRENSNQLDFLQVWQWEKKRSNQGGGRLEVLDVTWAGATEEGAAVQVIIAGAKHRS